MDQVAYEYEEQIVKLKRCLIDLIQSSDEPLSVPINWRDVGILGHPFHKVLKVPVTSFGCGGVFLAVECPTSLRLSALVFCIDLSFRATTVCDGF